MADTKEDIKLSTKTEDSLDKTILVKTKTCNTCNEDKALDRFRPRCICCMDCRNKKRREDRRAKDPKKYDLANGSKICSKCNVEQPPINFGPKRRSCIECERAYGRAYRKNNPEKGKKWIEDNRERFAELQHNRYEANKSKIRAKDNERFKNDPIFRAVKSHRIAVNNMYVKGFKTSKHTPFKGDAFRTWIAHSMQEGMTKANYGKYWNFDHVLPLDLFEDKYYNQFLTQIYNIRPVVCHGNLSKNKYIDKELFDKHLNEVEKYFTDDSIVKLTKVSEYVKCLRDTLLRESLARS